MQTHREAVTTWAEWLYDVLLWLYPARHRQAYGSLMRQLFLDQLRDAQAEGRWSVLTLWLRTVIDVLRSAPGEHLRTSVSAPNQPLLSWRGAVLMVIPALLLLSAYLPGLGISTTVLYVIVAPIACTILVAALIIWKRTKRIPIWGMPVLGMAITTLVWVLTTLPGMLVSGLFSQRTPPFRIAAAVSYFLNSIGLRTPDNSHHWASHTLCPPTFCFMGGLGHAGCLYLDKYQCLSYKCGCPPCV